MLANYPVDTRAQLYLDMLNKKHNEIHARSFTGLIKKKGFFESDQEFQENLPFLIRNLQSDLLLLSVKKRESRKVLLNEDPQIIQALASLPQASLLPPLKNNLGQGDNFYYE